MIKVSVRYATAMQRESRARLRASDAVSVTIERARGLPAGAGGERSSLHDCAICDTGLVAKSAPAQR